MLPRSVRQVSSPLTRDDLSPLDPEVRLVQFNTALSENEYRRLAGLLAQHPDVGLRVYFGHGSIADLEFLRFFSHLRSFAVDVFEIRDLSGLQYLTGELEDLALGWTRSKVFSLKMLERFPRLKTLYLEGQQKDIGSIGALQELKDLTLRSITLPDLSSLLPLRNLRSLDIKLGGTSNLGLLPQIGRLEYLELWMIRGLTDVSSVAQIPSLQRLFLQSLPRVTALPSFRASEELRHVTLYTMKGVTDLRPLAEAPRLERLDLTDMSQLQPESLLPFVGHPTLHEAHFGLGSDRKNQAAWKLLQLGPRPPTWAEYKKEHPPRGA